MKKLFTILAVAAAMVSCAKEDVVSVSRDAAIAFDGIFVENATRANDPSTTADNIEAFYVWAVIDNETGIVFNDEEVSKSGDSWTYTQTQQWVPGHHYYFSAIAGDRENNQIVLNLAYDDKGMSKKGLGTATFTNVNGTNDFLYAEYKVKTPEVFTTTPEAVKFQFNHLLSKVKFTFENAFANENNTIVITDVQMTAPAKATIDLTADEYAWTNHADVVTLDMGHVAAAGRVAAGSSASTDNERLTIPAGANQEYTVTFKIQQWQGDVLASSATKTITINGVELLPGRGYNFKATINEQNVADNPLYDIEFDVAVDEWEQDQNVETEILYTVGSAQDLIAIANGINNGTIESDATVVLTDNIDLADVTRAAVVSNWNPIGTEEAPFTGTFDGKGYTIKNLCMIESEAKEGKAYIGFFGFAKNATIKNVTFENVYIDIPCLDIDHSQGHIGAVAGSLEGTSTIENVTVKGDIKVEATTTANGASRVAVVAGGNSYGNVTMKNVHVIANEGSYLKANNNVGALAGQLQGKSVFENCSSNINVTGTKFFAGGLIGLAAGDQLFTNCHTTGDVTITAGRAGRQHDHYRVGGIAGGWADGATKVCTLVDCSYTGELSGTNADGSVVEEFDYMGYVGRGYTLTNCKGSKVVIDGVEFVQAFNAAAEAGIYYVNGELTISTAATLKAFANMVNNGTNYFKSETVKLGADIDLKGAEWTPIGSASKDHGFMGNFDGNGFVIKNLAIKNIALDADGYAYAGLFGVTEGVDEDNQNYIKNLVIENVNIETTGHIVAAAIAYPYYTALENIKVQGDVNIKGGNYTAGVLAYTRRCVDAKDIAIEANQGSVIEGAITIGGVISDIQTNGGLTANYSDFAASGVTIKGVKNVGGISGIICLQTLDGATVKNVTIVCNDARTGIVAGADGGKSTLTNVSYENVTGATRVIGATYDKGNYVGQIVEVAGQKAVVFSIENGVKAFSVAELNLNGKYWQDAIDWAAGLGNGWELASMEDLNAIYDLRCELNDALEADNADNALFWEGDELYIKNGSVYYALYMSRDEVPAGETDANGNEYWENRVFFKKFNKLGYSDVLYSAFDCINKYAPLRDNYFARAVYTL